MLVTAGPVAATAEPVHEYEVRVDEALTRLEVEARFAAPQGEVHARSGRAGGLLTSARDCDSGEVLGASGRRLPLRRAGTECLRYSVDLERAARTERRNRMLADDNLLLSPSVWLWRPALADGSSIRVRFRLPGDIEVSVPWARAHGEENVYLLAASPESAHAPAAFGRFEQHEISSGGARLRVSLLAGEPALETETVLNWLRAAAADVALAYGRFPNPSPQVVVIPIGHADRQGGSAAVPFGRVIRDGGESIEFFVDQRRPVEDFLADWTATHEFSHLMLPYLERRYRWISEGFAQYYQNVLRARSGAYTAEQAWQKLYEGLERGRRSRPELSPNGAAATARRGARMKVYWSGAALALLADVELRGRSGGRESLDLVLDRLQACCLPSPATWSGPELLSKLDSLAGSRVFMPLYQAHAETPGFPDTGALFDRLGIDIIGGRVRLREKAELVAIRDAITGLDADTARWREQLAAD